MLAEVGQPWPDASVPAPAPSPEEIARLKQLTPQYGLRIG